MNPEQPSQSDHYAMSQSECARARMISRSNVQRIEVSALKKLRRALADKGLPPSVMIPLLRSL